MSDSKIGSTNISSSTSIDLLGSTSYYYLYWSSLTGLSAAAGGTSTATFTGFFNRATWQGDLKIYAFSPTLGTVKYVNYGYMARTANSISTHSSDNYAATVESGNSGTGGSNMTISLSGNDLVVTIDFTDGENVAVSDGECHVYYTRIL